MCVCVREYIHNTHKHNWIMQINVGMIVAGTVNGHSLRGRYTACVRVRMNVREKEREKVCVCVYA